MDSRILSFIVSYVDGVEVRIKAYTDEKFAESAANNEATETRLLNEFWKWARTSDARYRQSHAVVGALDDRVQAIEDRVAELERRKAS
jgi:hypothetical protein